MATPEEQGHPADAIVTTGTGRKALRSMIFPKALYDDTDSCLKILCDVLLLRNIT